MPPINVADRFHHNGTEYIVCCIDERKVYTERCSDGKYREFSLKQVQQVIQNK